MIGKNDGRQRVVIENVSPEINCGAFPVKRCIGEKVTVQADIFCDGHDSIAAELLFRTEGEAGWHSAAMAFYMNDRWRGSFDIADLCTHYYCVRAWVDYFTTWQKDIAVKARAGQDIAVDVLIGVDLIKDAAGREQGGAAQRLSRFADQIAGAADTEHILPLALSSELSALMAGCPDRRFASTYEKELRVTVDRTKARFSAWYEVFPRSCADSPEKHGTLKDCERLLPYIAGMGFDVLYLPPIHPIGTVNRKGKNNSPSAGPADPGSPWAIGSSDGGHTAVHTGLGTIDDFKRLMKEASEHGLEIAMDLAYQCAPDHPSVSGHPGWFKKRPDGTIQFAENPPKKYEDVVPYHFESDRWEALWEELRSIARFWIDHGVRIFRVDNPHTKPFLFWEWLIQDIKAEHPETIFLAEAFTRPKVMARLAKAGFTQSYTYFTWRNTKHEITAYLNDLTQTELSEYFRPNFWPNTPDILPEFLQYGGRPAFILRLILAATLSSNYGIYGPAFELCAADALPDREEYRDSEKYEIRRWNINDPASLAPLITSLNKIRRENPALHKTANLRFHDIDNNSLLFYSKASDDGENIIICIVNLDPFHTQSGWLKMPLQQFTISPAQPYLVHDLLSTDRFFWQGENNFVELNPSVIPAHIFRIHRRMRRESDFDYFM